jgi:hypothetical protein
MEIVIGVLMSVQLDFRRSECQREKTYPGDQ